jgi:hypothetical protein
MAETETQETTEEAEFSPELTERETLIAQGLDPDASPPPEDDPPAGEEIAATPPADEVPSEPAELEVGETSEEGPKTWLNDEYFALADSYGLSMDDVKSMSGPEELARVGRALDNQIVLPVEEKVPAEPEPEEEAHPAFAGGKIDPKWFEDEGYDDVTINIAKQLRTTQEVLEKHQNSSDAILGHYALEQQTKELNLFHDAVDKLDPEFYGNSIDDAGKPIAKLPDNFAERRQKNLEGVSDIATELAERQRAQGKAPSLPGYDVLVGMAHKKLFPEAELKGATSSKEREAALTKQSKKRRKAGGSSGATVSNRVPRSTGPFDAAELANDPELTTLWNSFQEANGVT